MTILTILNQIAATSKISEKLEILEKHKFNKTLYDVCQYAYHPTIKFWIKKRPQAILTGDNSLDWAINTLISKISTRLLTGNAAILAVEHILNNISADDQEVIYRIIEKDLKSGFGTKLINKVWKNAIPEYPYMRCSLIKSVKLDSYTWKSGVYSQLKADGLYAAINLYNDNSVSILTRNGTEFPLDEFSTLISGIQRIFEPGSQYHGELLIRRDGDILPRQLGNGVLNSIAQGGKLEDTDEIVFLVWDSIPLDCAVPKGSYNVPYSVRFNDLVERDADGGSNSIVLIPTRIVHNMDEAMDHYREMLEAGLEGTILKSGNAIWKDGTSKEQCKLKLDIDLDLVVKGFNEGKGKNADTFGSIICESSCGKLRVNVSGFTDADRLKIHNTRESLMDTVIVVKSNNLMSPTKDDGLYSLFLPRFVEFRNDKTEADSLERIIEQFENAMK